MTQEKHPGGNASGVSDLVPTERQLDIVKEVVPNLKTLGLVYDPSLDNARSTVESIKALAPKMGFKTLKSPAMGLNNVPSAGQALVGKVWKRSSSQTTLRYTARSNPGEDRARRQGADLHGRAPECAARRRRHGRLRLRGHGQAHRRHGRQGAQGHQAGDMDVQYMKDLPNSLALYVNKASAEQKKWASSSRWISCEERLRFSNGVRDRLSDITIESLRVHWRPRDWTGLCACRLGGVPPVRVLDFPDLTVEGSFPLGAAVAAKLMISGVDASMATWPPAWPAACGLRTAFLNRKLRILHILAGILTAIALYSVNLRIMDRPNVGLINMETVYTPIERLGVPSLYAPIVLLAVVVVIFKILIDLFLATGFGLAMRAAGANPRSRRQMEFRSAADYCRLGDRQRFNSDQRGDVRRNARRRGRFHGHRRDRRSARCRHRRHSADAVAPHTDANAGMRAGFNPLPACPGACAQQRRHRPDRFRRECGDCGSGCDRLMDADTKITGFATAGRAKMIRVENLGVIFNRGPLLKTEPCKASPYRFSPMNSSRSSARTVRQVDLDPRARCREISPSTGRIFIDGAEVTGWPVHRRATDTGAHVQDPRVGICEDMSIIENIGIAAARTSPRGFRFAITEQLRQLASERLSSCCSWALRSACTTASRCSPEVSVRRWR